MQSSGKVGHRSNVLVRVGSFFTRNHSKFEGFISNGSNVVCRNCFCMHDGQIVIPIAHHVTLLQASFKLFKYRSMTDDNAGYLMIAEAHHDLLSGVVKIPGCHFLISCYTIGLSHQVLRQQICSGFCDNEQHFLLNCLFNFYSTWQQNYSL